MKYAASLGSVNVHRYIMEICFVRIEYEEQQVYFS